MKKLWLWPYKRLEKWRAVRPCKAIAGMVGLNLTVWSLYKIIILLSLLASPLPINKLEHDYGTVYMDSRGGLMHMELSNSRTYRLFTPLEDISPFIIKGFLNYEDQYFFFHQGINPVAVIQALALNLKNGKILRGGSTITLQLARMMEPKPRTVAAKIREAFRALQLEGTYSKKKLLEIYLNSVPMGGNIMGVGAAAYLYFGKPASDLSLAEAALLVGLPKSPNNYRPDLNPIKAQNQRNRILRRLAGKLHVNHEDLKEAFQAKVPARRLPNPLRYPFWILRDSTASRRPVRKYSVDPHLQEFCEEKLAEAHLGLEKLNIHNGALMVVDNRSMKVLAYLGSADFYDKNGGQINGGAILRSPGSLLKPFLYARAIETGMITPRRMVYDIPKDYDGYKPANYNRQSQGPIAAEDALLNSLNNPAVALEAALGAQGLTGLLQRSHLIGDRIERTDPGLAIVLGAMPLNLEELMKLYCMLANQGRLKDLVYYEDGKKHTSEGIRLLSKESTFLISEILAKQLRPDLPQTWEFTANRGKVAYKTGTSFGLRDAWTIGYTPHYTVGVWLGNVDAQGSSALVGAKAAAPIMIDIMNELTRYDDEWYEKPSGVAIRKVCSLSGEKAGLFCGHTRDDYYIPGISSENVCSVHRAIMIEKASGMEVTPSCMIKSSDAYEQKVIIQWPPDVASFLRQHGRNAGTRPLLHPDCNMNQEEGLKIEKPINKGFYKLTAALSDKQQRIPLQVVSCTDSPVAWYLDGLFVGACHPDKVLFITPAPGIQHLTAINQMGQTDAITFTVKR